MEKVWQITVYGLAEVFVDNPRADVAAHFLRERVVPHFRKAGLAVHRVPIDRGSEFQGAFDMACQELGIRHTRTRPRQASSPSRPLVRRGHPASPRMFSLRGDTVG